MLASVVAVFFLPDWPSNTKWLTPQQRALAVARIAADQPASALTDPPLTHLQALKAAISDWRIYVFSFMCTCLSTSSVKLPCMSNLLNQLTPSLFTTTTKNTDLMIQSGTTISYFIPTITLSLGYTGQMAQFMTVPFYLCACTAILVNALSADYFKDRVFHICIPTAIAGVMYALCAGITDPSARYGLIWFVITYILFFSLTFHLHIKLNSAFQSLVRWC